MEPLSMAATGMQLASIPLQAVGQYQAVKEGRRNRRFQVEQYLIEKAARDRATQRDQQQQQIANTLQIGNYGQNQAQSAMDIFGAYNRNIGR